MALTALTGGEPIRPQKEYPAKKVERAENKAEPTDVSRRKREDRLELRDEITRANQSAQRSAQAGAEQLLGRIDLRG